MPAIAAVRCSPMARFEGSLKDRSDAAVEAGAGDGVAGGCDVVEGADCTGAAGGAGVLAVAGFAGVAGSAGFDGAAFG